MTEKQFTELVIDVAHRFNWIVAHFTQSQVRPGVWITPVKADGKGFPDLVLVRDTVIFAELKVETRVSPDQVKWIAALEVADAEVHVWYPADMNEIELRLRRRPGPVELLA